MDTGSSAVASRRATADDLPFIHDGELGYIREREPEQEAAWPRAADRNRELWAANLERTTVLEIDCAPVAYAMWAVVDGVATAGPADRRRRPVRAPRPGAGRAPGQRRGVPPLVS